MNPISVYKSPAGEQAVMDLYDSLLARWPVPYQTYTLPTRFGHTFIISSGNEAHPPLILLHGAGSNNTMWIGDIAKYSRSKRTYAIDLIGEPGKSAPTRPSWSGSAYTQWLTDVLDGLKLDQVHLMGLSQGAWTALKFATSVPDRVKALVLLSPGGIVPDRLSFLLRVMPLMLLGRWGIHRTNQILFGQQPVPDGVDDVTAIIMAHFKSRIGALPIFTDAELQRLSMPVLLVMGGHDALRDAKAITQRMTALVPHVTSALIPEAGHALVNIAPRILDFLATAERIEQP